MDVKELRIGNWVMSNRHNVPDMVNTLDGEISGGLVYLEKCSGAEMKDIEPIQLTEDIFIQARFNHDRIEETDIFKIKVDYSMFNIENYYAKEEDGYILSEVIRDEYDDETLWPIGVPIKYVHQLQNLYFALTGKELDINLTTNNND